MEVNKKKILRVSSRKDWRDWLSKNFQKEDEIWLLYPKKHTGRYKILYNDAVEEALCFGWIDGIIKGINDDETVQRFTPRRNENNYSQQNRERLALLVKQKLIHPKILPTVKKIISEKFVFPEDILNEIKKDKEAWEKYQKLSPGYKRIRMAYLDGARKRPEEFKKRLKNFIEKTKEGKQIGFGGIEKYY